MDKRSAEADTSSDGAHAKKIKVEHAPEDAAEAQSTSAGDVESPQAPNTSRPTEPRPSPSPSVAGSRQSPAQTFAHPGEAASAPGGSATQAGLSNLDRLANIATHTQRSDGGGTPLGLRLDTSTPFIGTPTHSNLPFSLQQRLNAARAQQGAPPLGGASTPASGQSEQPMFDTLVDVMGYSGVDLRVRGANQY